ncbi:MAG: 4Fe-4S binding protein [Clostridiales bacterium]
MVRKIIKINEDKCNGCKLCVDACHEGALEIIDGKAKLISETYCDGLGDCLPICPKDAIVIEERESLEYNEEMVKKNIEKRKSENNKNLGCPGSMMKTVKSDLKNQSKLEQWPCQLKLVAANAPYFDNANLLIAADCTAFAYGNIHNDFMKNKVTLIGCPKLDNVDYSEKITQIISLNNLKSITVLKMIVPCCNGISNAVKNAIIESGKMIPLDIITINIGGSIVED